MATNARGHGAYGLRSGLRPFSELDSQSASRKHTYVEMYGGQEIGGPGSWTATGSGSWFVPHNEVFDGRPQDVVGVMIVGAMLTRVETIALCDSTAGSWYWDNDSAQHTIGGADDAGFGADLELGMDDGAELYVHLPAGVDPNAVDVVALTIFGFWTGTKENPSLAVQPILGPNLLADGGCEEWTTSTDLTQWVETLVGAGWSVNQAESIADDGGLYSARLVSTGAAAGSASLRQTITLQDGKSYRVTARYKTAATNPVTSGVYVQLPSSGTSPLAENGRDTLAGDGALLENTNGESLRLVFDLVWPAGGSRQLFRLVNSAATACEAWYDSLSIQRIYGWRWFEARLSAQGMPEHTQGASDVYPGTEEGGGGQLMVLNDATEAVPGIVGYVEGMLSRWTFSNKRVVFRHGGQFLDGQEITWEDMEYGFTGIIRKPGCSDQIGRFDLEEYRALLETELPLRRYNRVDTPNVREAALDRARPYWFGYLPNVSPERVDVTESTGLGIYELADPAIAPNGSTVMYTTAGALDHVWAYEDMDAAGAKDPLRRIELALSFDYDYSGSGGERLNLLKNPGPFRVVAGENDRADFVANGTTYTAEIAPGLKTIHQLKLDLTDLFNAFVPGTVTWLFNESSGGVPSHKYGVSYSGAGTFQLLLGTGANRDRSIYADIGFTGDDNLTGATGYTADTGMPYDPDTAHIIRVDNYGYRDDASGTYTGTANGPIKLASDILKVLLVKTLGVDAASQISSSFVTARTSCPQEQAAYLGGLTSVQGGASFSLALADVVERFEAGCFADIVTDPAGVFHFIPRTATVPASAPHFYDRDFLGWSGELPIDHTYGTVRVNFAQDPTTGLVQGREVTQSLAALLHGRPNPRTFDTFLRFEYDAANSAQSIAALARAPIRHYAFRAIGKGRGMKVGDIALLTRARAIQGAGETGGLNADSFRVMYLSKNPTDGSVSYVVATNIIS